MARHHGYILLECAGRALPCQRFQQLRFHRTEGSFGAWAGRAPRGTGSWVRHIFSSEESCRRAYRDPRPRLRYCRCTSEENSRGYQHRARHAAACFRPVASDYRQVGLVRYFAGCPHRAESRAAAHTSACAPCTSHSQSAAGSSIGVRFGNPTVLVSPANFDVH
jgi:hypothetical protein